MVRLPPEREPAESLSVSRSSLRKALLVLDARGQLERLAGKGTFFRAPGNLGLTDAGKLAVFAMRRHIDSTLSTMMAGA